jgi:hypothetical protein
MQWPSSRLTRCSIKRSIARHALGFALVDDARQNERVIAGPHALYRISFELLNSHPISEPGHLLLAFPYLP